jgi:hypothetical protein
VDQYEEKIRWAMTAYKGSPAVLDQVGPAVREEALRRIRAEQERSRGILRERDDQLAKQLGPGEVARRLYVE